MNIVLCMPVSMCSDPVHGSVKESCVSCLTPVWVAPTSVKLMQKEEVAVQCLPCGMKNAEPGSEFTAAPGAIEELEAEEQRRAR